jgi:hypothetical protein
VGSDECRFWGQEILNSVLHEMLRKWPEVFTESLGLLFK